VRERELIDVHDGSLGA